MKHNDGGSKRIDKTDQNGAAEKNVLQLYSKGSNRQIFQHRISTILSICRKSGPFILLTLLFHQTDCCQKYLIGVSGQDMGRMFCCLWNAKHGT